MRRPDSLLLEDLPPGLEHRFIDVGGGVNLHAVASGLGSGRPLVVLLHGFPEMWRSWRHQIAALQGSYEVMALDMRGYGLSDAPKGERAYTMGRLVGDVAAAVRAAGHSSCLLAAHDWGGAVAWCFAANYPHMVRRLAILCSPHPAAYEDPRRFNAAQARRSWYFLLFMARGLPEAWLRARDFEAVAAMMAGPPMGARTPGAIGPDDLARQKAALGRPGALTAAVNYYRASIRDQSSHPSAEMARGVAAVLPQPVLLLYADADAAFCEHMFTVGTADNVPNLTLARLDKCSHWANQDRPDLVNPRLLEFFGADATKAARPGSSAAAARPTSRGGAGLIAAVSARAGSATATN